VSFYPGEWKGVEILMPRPSLALLELQVILTKLLYVYDLEMVDDGKDFESESRSFLFWRKSKVLTCFNRRQGVIAP
jgi:hypothetical protein